MMGTLVANMLNERSPYTSQTITCHVEPNIAIASHSSLQIQNCAINDAKI